jgi:hypothetical protein
LTVADEDAVYQFLVECLKSLPEEEEDNLEILELDEDHD